MKSAFFIMVLWQTGNVGPHNIRKLTGQPEEGYKDYESAKTGMVELKEAGQWELSQVGWMYKFTIIEIFEST